MKLEVYKSMFVTFMEYSEEEERTLAKRFNTPPSSLRGRNRDTCTCTHNRSLHTFFSTHFKEAGLSVRMDQTASHITRNLCRRRKIRQVCLTEDGSQKSPRFFPPGHVTCGWEPSNRMGRPDVWPMELKRINSVKK